MLSDKPWKPLAVVRLIMSVFVCIYAGSLLVSVVHCSNVGVKVSATAYFALAGVALVCLMTSLVLLNQPWRVENLMQRLMALLLFFYAGIFVGAWVQKWSGPEASSIAQLVIATLSFQGAGLVLIGRFLREHQMSWGEAFGLSNHWRHAVLVGTVAACIFLPLGWGLQQASALVVSHVPHFPVKPEEQQAVQALRTAVSWADKIAGGAVTILLVPVTEELLFRGILYPGIKQAGYPRLALWGTALLFAAIHANVIIFAPLFVLAIMLTILYERTGNLLAPIAAHSLFNGLNFAMLFLLDQRLS
jgi:membrane protease YdiL (CAAX protease family)